MSEIIQLPRYYVRPMEHRDARPFVSRYIVRWGLPFDPIRFASASWWGSYKEDDERPSAVLGLEVMPNKSVFVEGFYSDETREGMRALKRLLEFGDSIQAPLFATVHYQNQDMIDFVMKHLNARHRRWETTALVIHSPWEEQESWAAPGT